MFKSKVTTIIAVTALVVAVFGATPLGQAASGLVLAKNSVGAAQLKNDAVVGKKIAKNAVTGAKVKDGSLLAADFKAGQLPAGSKGDKGDPGQQGIQGVQGTAGTARAYALVQPGGTFTRSKNVAAVSNPAAGIYCISLAGGIDASKTGLVVTPNFANDATTVGIGNSNQAIAEWASDGMGCPAGQLKVETAFREEFTVSSPDGDVRQVANTVSNEPFFFVVP